MMKAFTYYILALTLASFSFLHTHAQTNGITDLHKFMQLNADTTFLLEYQSGWLLPPQYWLVSKKGDTTTAYIYDLPQKYNVLMPKSIRSAIYRSNGFNPSRKIEINQFFRPVPMPDKYKGKIWDILMKEEPWKIPDDKVDGTRCPPSKNRVEIEDGGSVNLYLITAKEIKILSFYAPDFYEEQCPGRKGRQSIIRIDKLFRDLFKTGN